ncbi:MAG: DUF3037 domain-containing protein [Solirubrobacterales bacterium]|nr:DUF3037 domain-containing protein [Solirubrobacterales bacterium]
MPEDQPQSRPFSYAVLRVVPCLERGERLNVGLALFCRQHGFLDLETGLDRARLAAIAPDLDPGPVEARLAVIRQVIEGDPAVGALAELDPSDRFGWLTAPSSTIIQSSEVHTGLTTDPAAELKRLFESLVL